MNKEHDNDKKIAEMIFRRHFRGFTQFQDDMIQLALIRLWQSRKENFISTFTGCCEVARRAMIDFLRKESKYFSDVSINATIKDDLSYMDILTDGITTEMMWSCTFLSRQSDEKTDCMNDKAKEIIRMYLNRRSYSEIARAFRTTKQNVAKYVSRFRKALVKEFNLGEAA